MSLHASILQMYGHSAIVQICWHLAIVQKSDQQYHRHIMAAIVVDNLFFTMLEMSHLWSLFSIQKEPFALFQPAS